MFKPKTYSIKEVLDNTFVSPILDFYSSKDEKFIVEDLSKLTNKKVLLTLDNKSATYTTSILLKEYDIEKPLYRLSFGWLPFKEILPILENVLGWIKENASVNYFTLLRTSLTYNERNLQTLEHISNMNIGKMILKIDEEWIWKRFPEMKTSPFALSVKKLAPTNSWLNVSDILININETFELPNADYYGINFQNQPRSIIEFNYIGGEKYPEKIKEIKEVLEYYAIITYQNLNEKTYTSEQLNELRRITSNYRKLQKCYYNYNYFLKEYKDIKVYVDLNRGEQIMKSYWTKLRDPLLKLIIETGFEKGRFNLDTDSGYYQLKEVELDNVRINNFEIIDSKISGIIENCHLWKTKVNSSRVIGSTFIQNNKINESFLTNTRIDRENKLNKSYIVNNGEIINCKINESIIRNAGIGKNAKIDESTTIVNKEQRMPEIPKDKGINIEEIRDYRWLKSLDGEKEDKGFANEYKDINYD